ncbi:MAG: hypothetical protein ABIH86_06855 [Planctomycetota bacterium]
MTRSTVLSAPAFPKAINRKKTLYGDCRRAPAVTRLAEFVVRRSTYEDIAMGFFSKFNPLRMDAIDRQFYDANHPAPASHKQSTPRSRQRQIIGGNAGKAVALVALVSLAIALLLYFKPLARLIEAFDSYGKNFSAEPMKPK